MLNLLTLHTYSGKDREIASKRDPLLKNASWGGFLNGFICFRGSLFIRDFFPKLYIPLSQKRTFLFESFAQVSLTLKAVVREEMGPHLATGLSPSYDLTRILSISCLSISLSLSFSLSSPHLTFCPVWNTFAILWVMLFDVRLIQEAFERLISWEIGAAFSNIEMRAVVRFLIPPPYCSFFLVIILLGTLSWGMDAESPFFDWMNEVYPCEYCRLLSSGSLTGIFSQGWGC